LPAPTTGIVVWALLVLVFALPAFVVAFEAAMHFQGVAIDGPFQLYNALRRIQAGYRPGIDFQFFHGMGVPYAHYWLYRLFGGGFAGSEMARQLIGTTAYVLVFLVFFRAFAQSRQETLCLTVGALALSWLLKFTAIMFAQIGMLGLRSALPTLLPVALYLARTPRQRVIAAGMMIGVGLLMSTEQGIAALLAYVIVSIVVAIRAPRPRERVGEAAATIGIAIVTVVALLTAVGGFNGMRGALRYNFSTVPRDQYWYFGVPPNQFISSWWGGLKTLIMVWPVGLAIVAGMIVSFWYLRHAWRSARAPDTKAARRAFALATLPVYGVISCGSLLGVLSTAYAQPLWRTLVLTGLLAVAHWSAAHDERTRRPPWLGVSRSLCVGVVILSAWTLLRVRLVAATLYTAAVHVSRDHLTRHVGFTAGGIWPETLKDGQAIIDANRGPSGELPVLWSTYSGWIEARNGLFNPSFDYIIHSLGPDNRRAYVDAFRASRPLLVQTMSPMYSGYEPWLENSNWEFYDELLTWYEVTGRTPWSLYWERRATPAPAPELLATIPVAPGAPYVALPKLAGTAALPTSILEVEVEYTVDNPLRSLPLIGASPRYLIGVGGAYNDTPVSLAPYARRARFLLLASPEQTPSLHFQTFSLLPGASYAPSVVRVYSRPMDERNQKWVMLMLQRYTSHTG
jgi:hypothetical protein